LSYADSAKLATTATGVDVTGTVTMDGGSTSADFTFGDNDKAIFGAGSDLQIYHNGSHSTIEDVGTGNLQIHATDFRLRNSAGTESIITANADGAVSLFYDNALKLATTSTGVDVTGTITSDGLTVQGDILLSPEGSEIQFNTSSTFVNKIYTDDTYVSNGLTVEGPTGVTLKSDNNYLVLDDTSTNEMVLSVDGGERMRVTSTGVDITGTITSDGLTVDGDAEINGIAPRLYFMESDATDLNTRLINSAGAFVVQTSADAQNSHTTRLKLDHSTGDISFYEDTGTTPKFFWDASAESLGIGTSSPSQTLHLKDTGINTVVLIEGSTSGGSFVNFADSTDTNVGQIGYDHTSDYMQFRVNDDEAMRLDSSGNLLVGTTSTSISNEGAVIFPSGVMTITNDDGRPLRLNRKTSDGNILDFNKDGSTVGSIGVDNSDNLYIQGTSTGAGLQFATDDIIPHRNGAYIGDTLNLGNLNYPFNDLFLSGGVYLGGTGSANHLDDYETGTFTMGVTFASTEPTDGPTQANGYYVKTGNSCTIWLTVIDINVTGGAGDLRLNNSGGFDGLPFISSLTGVTGQGQYMGSATISFCNVGTTNTQITSQQIDGVNYIRFIEQLDNAANDIINVNNCSHGNTDISLCMTYPVA